MRITRLAVENVRTLTACDEDIDGNVVLITGPNESGKSTLVDALRKGLVLRAAGNNANTRSLVSRHGGYPSVTVEICVDGEFWRSAKVWQGNANRHRLERFAGGSHLVFEGDDADRKLAELTRMETHIGAGTIQTELDFLFALQGNGGDDALSGEVAEHLLRLLKDDAGDVHISAHSQKLHEAIKQRFEQFFTKTGSVRAQTDLARAIQERAEAEASLAEHEAELKRSEEDRETVGRNRLASVDAAASKATLVAELETARQEAATAAEAARHVSRRKNDLEQQKSDVTGKIQNLKRKLIVLKSAADALADAKKKVASHEKIPVPHEARLALLQQEFASAKERLTEVADSLRQLRTQRRTTLPRMDAARRHLEALQKAADFKEREGLLRRAGTIDAAREEAADVLAKLPNVDADWLRKVESQQRAIDDAELSLKAMATEITLIAGTDVFLDGTPLQPSAGVQLTAAGKLQVGDATIRIRPGGEADVGVARQQLEDARSALDASLAYKGIRTIDEARKTITDRGAAEDICREQTTLLELLVPDGVEALKITCATLAAEVARLKDRTPDAPTTVDTARSAVETLQQALDHIVGDLEAAQTRSDEIVIVRDKAASEIESIEQAQNTHLETGKSLSDAVDHAKTVHDTLVNTSGEPAPLEARLTTLQQEFDAVTGALAAHAEDVKKAGKLNADCEATVTRLKKSVEAQEIRIKDADQALQQAVGRLRGFVDRDLSAELDLARQQLAVSKDRVAHLQRDADAVKRLKDLFDEQAHNALERIVIPFRDAVVPYLQDVFGPDVEVRLSTGGGIGSGQLERNNVGFTHEELSGGAKEQFGVALRIAMGTVLAHEHNGCLPVILDEAFVNSDPDRLRRIKPMLYRAAHAGLQLIVLSSNLDDWQDLGPDKWIRL